MLKFFGYKKCGTCRKAEKFLEGHQVAYDFVDITLTPPSQKDLGQWIDKSGLDLKKFFNTSGEAYRDLDIKSKLSSMSKAEAVKLLAQNGRLIKRPLVTDGKKVTVGFNEETFSETWGES